MSATTRRPAPYAAPISTHLVALGLAAVDPRHVEAYMRLEHSTLDGLPFAQFREEVRISALCAMTSPDDAEALAESFGL